MPRVKGAAAGANKGKPEAGEPAQPPAVVLTDGAAVVAHLDADAAGKKKRNNNPGIRVLGGRVYDSENGTTCHQCRQKTAEVKAKCTRCTLYFCPKCLENRYQEKVAEVNALPGWGCPRCRGDCNCSNCRKKQGKEATGQLAQIAKKAGFGSVKDLLQKNPNAKALQLPRVAAGSSSGGSSEGPEEQQQQQAARKRQAQKHKAAVAAAQEELLPDEELPPRQQPMPEAQPLAVHKAPGGGTGGSKRQRGTHAWVAGVPAVTALPDGRAGAELAVVLEFLQVFGAKLQLRNPSLAALAAELLQPPPVAAAQQPQQQLLLLCPSPDDSLVAMVHCKLLDLVRGYWNVKGATTAASWQGVMRSYYAASLLTQRQALGLRWQHGPPAVAGEIFSRPAQQEEGDEEEQQEPEQGTDAGAAAVVAAGGAAPAASVDYPEGGYWALPPAARVGMMHSLVNDALECAEIRDFIEASMGDALGEEKERKQQLAGVRKEAREAVARERDQQIAFMITNTDSSGLTLERQQEMLEEARHRAEAAAHTAAAAKVKALTEKVHPPTVRAAVVGADRDGRRYLQLQAAALLTGDAAGGIIVQQAGGPPGASSDGSSSSGDDSSTGGGGSEALACYPASCLAGVAAALHPRGRQEGPLHAALVHAFRLPVVSEAHVSGSEQQEEGEEEQGPQGGEAAASKSGKAAAGRKAASKNGRPAVAPPAEAGSKAAVGEAKSGSKTASGTVKRSSSSAGCGPPPPAAAAAAAAGGSKRGRRTADAGKASKTSPAPALAPAAKRQKAGSSAAPTAAAAEGKRGSRRTSPRGGSDGKAAAGPGPAARASRVGGRRLPLKVDDMLAA